ncbi:hypothetical protein [Thalassotalea insulae]|uniref:hypothetical protein n=1 Tax=Thalassotalea insulae TaxID=2056778 RepID=UPI0024E0A9D0|nr:hypothetical protein [Thalassotalea insulae]
MFERQITKINTLILVLVALSVPVLFFVIIYGLAGGTSEYYYLISISYVGVFLFGIKTFFNPRFIIGTIIFSSLILLGFSLDSLYWESHNDELCKEVKENPSCTESQYGFSCKNTDGGSSHVSKSICN